MSSAERSPADGAPAGPGPLRFRAKATYATGDIVDGVITYGVFSFGFYYLTAVCGLSGAVAGSILAISTVTDAFADPLIGSISDNTRSRWGRRLPYMFAAAAPAAIGFGLFFSLPTLPAPWLAIYACAVLLMMRFAMSFYILPYAALGAELSTDYSERSVIFAYRTFFNCVGNITLLVLGYWVFMRGREGLLDRTAYAGFAWTCAAVALAAGLLSAFASAPLQRRLRPVAQQGLGPRALVLGAAEVVRNRSFWLLFISLLLFWTCLGIVAALTLHANLYFWRLPPEVVATLPMLNIAGYVVGVPLVTLLLTRFEKRNVALIGLALACSGLLMVAPLRIAGFLPDGPVLHAILGSLSFLGGVAGTCAFVPWGSMMADAADEHELLFGSRREGLYFAGLFLAAKAAAGLGGLFAGIGLDVIGFPRDVAAIGEAALPADVVTKLGLLHGPIAAVLGLAAAVVLMAYRIDAKRLGDIQREIAQRGQTA